MKTAKMAICVPTLLFLVILFSGCASYDQRVSLTYETAVNAVGGQGEIFLAKPVEKQGAVRTAEGIVVIGEIKETNRRIITKDDISIWIMNAFKNEMTKAGYSIKTIETLPEDVSKGIRINILKVLVNQETGLLNVKTSTEIKISADVFKNGKLIKTINTGSDSKDMDIDHSSDPITRALQSNLQNTMKYLVPDVIKELQAQ